MLGYYGDVKSIPIKILGDVWNVEMQWELPKNYMSVLKSV